jgi:hypothetical protein
MRHRIRFADAHRAARGALDWAHGCATLRPVLVQVGETQRMVANFCEMAVTEGFEPSVRLYNVQRFSKPPPSAARPRHQKAGW